MILWKRNGEQAGILELLELAAVNDNHVDFGVSVFGALLFHRLQYFDAFHHLPKNHMLTVQPARKSTQKHWSLHFRRKVCHFWRVGVGHSPAGVICAEEELRAVGVGSGVGHGKRPGAGVLQFEVLIIEGLTIDGLPSRPVVVGKVAALQRPKNVSISRILTRGAAKLHRRVMKRGTHPVKNKQKHERHIRRRAFLKHRRY